MTEIQVRLTTLGQIEDKIKVDHKDKKMMKGFCRVMDKIFNLL